MINESEYKNRRDRVLKKLSKRSVAVIYSGEHKVRSNDTEYPYRQNSNFYYLTGFKEASSCLMLIKKSKKTKTILFVKKKDEKAELWSGERLGEVEAKKRFLVDEVFTIDTFSKKLQEFLGNSSTLYFDFKLDYSKVKTIKRYSKDLSTYKNIALLIQKMRLIKSDSEIALIKEAVNITADAHHLAMSCEKVGLKEYEIQAEMEYVFKINGAYSDAYTSIVASASNANTLHYIKNDEELKSGDLILIDAGCEYRYYASDITRTIPVDKRFSEPQRELYELVLGVQKEIISMIEPDILRTHLQKRAVELLSQGLIDLGILNKSLKKIIKKELYKPYYPHGIGHWMGLDVHDEAPYRDKKNREIPLKKGMILTIEPALYIAENDKKAPKKYRGIGIRIEDNILVTKKGYENLSAGIVKEIVDVEGCLC